MPARVVVIGLDAVSPALLRQWAATGHLPTLHRLMEAGISGEVRGVEGFYIGSTWPSFYTGLGPAGHGFHYLVQLRPGSYDFYRPMEAPGGVAGTPFWTLASRAGRRVAVLDVPLSQLDQHLNGIQTVEWGGHDSVFGFQPSSAAVRSTVAATGAYPLPPSCDGRRRSVSDYRRFVRGLERAAALRTDLALRFLGQEPWDLFVQVFTESHCAGHQCWHIHDPDHPAHDPALLRQIGDPLLQVYQAIDRGLGRILDQANGATVIVVSAHGMGPWRGAQFLLPEILFRLGVTMPPPVDPPPTTRGSRGRSVARRVWRTFPRRWREVAWPIRERLTGRQVSNGLPRLNADPAASRCFPVPTGLPIGGIRLNLRGREPLGVLEPGPQCEEFVDSLSRDLVEIIDERTGGPLVARVIRTGQLWRGPRLDALPDLLVEWSDAPATGSLQLAGGVGATVRASSPRIGTLEGSNSYGRSGEHLRDGIFMATGPDIPTDRSTDPVSVMDFHPTICRLLALDPGETAGIPIPGFT